MLAQLSDAGIGFIKQMNAGADYLAQVVRRNVGGHADGNAGGAIDQHMRHARGQPGRLVQRAIEVGRPVHRTLTQFTQQGFGNWRQLRFGVAHRRKRLRVVLRAEIALAAHQGVAVGEGLRHQHHGFVAGAVPVRMEFANDITHRSRGLLRFGAGIQAQLAHRVDDAALHRLEPVANEWQGAIEHHIHRIVEIGALRIVLERDLFVVALQGHGFRSPGRRQGACASRELCRIDLRIAHGATARTTRARLQCGCPSGDGSLVVD